MTDDEMAKPVFIGDEVTAAGFRLAGLSCAFPAPEDTGEALERALGKSDLVLLGAEHAAALPNVRLERALRDTETTVLVVADINGGHVPVDMEKRIRGLLGIET